MSYCDTGFDMVGNTTVLLCDEAPSTSAAWPWGGRMHFLPGSVCTDGYMTSTHFIIQYVNIYIHIYICVV